MDVNRGHNLPNLETNALTCPVGPAPGLVRTISCLRGCLGRRQRKRPYAMYTLDMVSARVLRHLTTLDHGKELLQHRGRGPRYDL